MKRVFVLRMFLPIGAANAFSRSLSLLNNPRGT